MVTKPEIRLPGYPAVVAGIRQVSWLNADGEIESLECVHIVGFFNYLTQLADGFGSKLDAKTEDAAATVRALQRLG